ncbi:MAG: tRNA (N6-isopentenyl adenosine(37)-C2)-methylthiotransferase MiaB [Pseudomonadota bacterium]
MSKRLFIHTIGCQMNVYDTEKMAAVLWPLGYHLSDSAADADMVVVNTCAIREKAEQKVFSYLGRLAEHKRLRPDMIVAVGGCVAQQEGARILKRVPAVDLVFGTHAIGRLPELVERVLKGARLVDTHQGERIEELWPAPDAPVGHGISRFITIMHGCDNYCTYCVVPYVRGRESSRTPDAILAEIHSVVDMGAREVTLLGQNVNSYGIKEGMASFAQLLEMASAVPDLLRIRFTTSHPKDLSDELVSAFARVSKLCAHIHLPVQSGADRILHRMNRRYTREHYLEKIALLRESDPKIAISTDIIVGFPGETDTDFADTLSLISEASFDGLFAFQYSDRPSAPASRFGTKVPAAVKKERLQAVLNLQEAQTLGKNQALEGTIQEILVEGRSRAIVGSEKTVDTGAASLWTGRTGTNRIVHFDAGDHGATLRPGVLVSVCIENGFSHSLRGRLVRPEKTVVTKKGVEQHAA